MVIEGTSMAMSMPISLVLTLVTTKMLPLLTFPEFPGSDLTLHREEIWPALQVVGLPRLAGLGITRLAPSSTPMRIPV
jgi:hypothetical protein